MAYSFKTHWEIQMLYDRYPNGCGKGYHCVHPADDCACDDCERRHSYRLLKSHIMNKLITIRLN